MLPKVTEHIFYSIEVKQMPTPKTRSSQVLVKVKSAGVCHSDIHLWEGGYK